MTVDEARLILNLKKEDPIEYTLRVRPAFRVLLLTHETDDPWHRIMNISSKLIHLHRPQKSLYQDVQEPPTIHITYNQR